MGKSIKLREFSLTFITMKKVVTFLVKKYLCPTGEMEPTGYQYNAPKAE